jgi:hypothetical protein
MVSKGARKPILWSEEADFMCVVNSINVSLATVNAREKSPSSVRENQDEQESKQSRASEAARTCRVSAGSQSTGSSPADARHHGPTHPAPHAHCFPLSLALLLLLLPLLPLPALPLLPTLLLVVLVVVLLPVLALQAPRNPPQSTSAAHAPPPA